MCALKSHRNVKVMITDIRLEFHHEIDQFIQYVLQSLSATSNLIFSNNGKVTDVSAYIISVRFTRNKNCLYRKPTIMKEL